MAAAGADRAGGNRAPKAALDIKARRHPLIAQFVKGLARCGVDLNESDADETAIVLGVSGGADSMALLLCAAIVSRHRKTRSKLKPTAVHVHHHLRDSADNDAACVADLCKRLNVDLRVVHVHPKSRPGNLAANARHLRYAALTEVAETSGARRVAVAHHVEDQCETVLASLCRGAGLEGLSGMAMQRQLSDHVALIRPLLHVRRADCESLCRAANVKWCDDPSNLDRTKKRNRLRQEVMPILNQMWPDAAARIAAIADVAEVADHLLEQALAQTFGPAEQQAWERRTLQKQLPVIVMAGLRRAAIAANPAEVRDELTHSHLEQAADFIRSQNRRPHRFDWPGELHLHVTSKTVELRVRPQGVSRSRNKGNG